MSASARSSRTRWPWWSANEDRAGLDILTHGDYHCDEDMAGRAWHHYPLQRWTGLEGDFLQAEETRSEWLKYPPGTLLHEIYTGWRWPRVTDKIEHRPLDYAKIWRIAQQKIRKPVRFGTCCSQVMSLFLDIHTPKYKDKREVIWDLAVAMNRELLTEGGWLQVYPGGGAVFPLHGQYVRKRPRADEVHDRGLQPRSRGPRRRRDLDPHLLGQSEHAAGEATTPATRPRSSCTWNSVAATSGRWK